MEKKKKKSAAIITVLKRDGLWHDTAVERVPLNEFEGRGSSLPSGGR